MLQANTTAVMGAERVTFSGWKYSHYFDFIEDIGKNIEVNANCAPTKYYLLPKAALQTQNTFKSVHRET